MALIQDIQPLGKGNDHTLAPSTLQGVRVRMLQVHKATNLPNLAQQTQKRLTRPSSFDVMPPGHATARRPKPETPVGGRFRQRPARTMQPITKPTLPSRPAAPAVSQQQVAKPALPRTTLGRRLADFAQYPLIAGLAIGAAYSSTVGQYCILAFAIVSLVIKLSSRFSFGAALLLLASIPFFQVLHQSGVSQNAAIYAYELLVAGTVLAIVELFRDRHQKSSTTTPQR